MDKIFKMLGGIIVLMGSLGFLALLLRPGWRIVGAVGLVGMVALVIVWWLVAVRSHGSESTEYRDDGLTDAQRDADLEGDQPHLWY